MSATSRTKKDGTTTERAEADFYPTPEWCTIKIMQRLKNELEVCGKRWLEPCAGDGDIIQAVQKFSKLWQLQQPRWTAIELRREANPKLGLAVYEGNKENSVHCPQDFLKWTTEEHDVAITNPPFSLWETFLHKSQATAPVVLFLLRLDVLGGDLRHRLWQSDKPAIYVMSKRPSFTGDGGTDSSYYGWFCWGIGKPGTWEVI